MTPQPTAVVAELVRTPPSEARHGHDDARYWDVDECRWQCAAYPGLRYALERCAGIGRPVADTGPETRP
jgi:hypothetical protein